MDIEKKRKGYLALEQKAQIVEAPSIPVQNAFALRRSLISRVRAKRIKFLKSKLDLERFPCRNPIFFNERINKLLSISSH